MEERKDDLGSVVSAICNCRQSALNTRVQNKVILREKASLLPTTSDSGAHVGLMASPDSLLCSRDGDGMEMGRGRESLSSAGPMLHPPTLQPEHNFLECPQVLGEAHYLQSAHKNVSSFLPAGEPVTINSAWQQSGQVGPGRVHGL